MIFDILNIMPYVRKHKKNPVTGEPLTPKDLVRLNISKNGDGKWHCPVTFKVSYIWSPAVLLLVVGVRATDATSNRSGGIFRCTISTRFLRGPTYCAPRRHCD